MIRLQLSSPKSLCELSVGVRNGDQPERPLEIARDSLLEGGIRTNSPGRQGFGFWAFSLHLVFGNLIGFWHRACRVNRHDLRSPKFLACREVGFVTGAELAIDRG
jgi:hypothetical protein